MKIDTCVKCKHIKKIRAKDMCPECYRKEYYKKNKESINKKWKKYYEVNKNKIVEWNKNYYEENKEEYLRKCNERARERRKTDINYRLRINLSSRIRSVIRKGYKNKDSLELLGCDVEFVRKYLEKKFTKGMTWEKFMNGEIHIDHIIPASSFDSTDEEEQKKCFHYTNLQPLWAKDNLKKGAKIIVP